MFPRNLLSYQGGQAASPAMIERRGRENSLPSFFFFFSIKTTASVPRFSTPSRAQRSRQSVEIGGGYEDKEKNARKEKERAYVNSRS